jgi:MSHA biogenesis protein MshO
MAGFTLIEMIVVIVIMGIIGAMVAVFMARPVGNYVDSARRAELSDIADTALRRMVRDLHLALPNSVRVTGTCDITNPTSICYVEFLLTSGSGRYRTAVSSVAPPGDPLDFVTADSSFDVLSPPLTFAGGESIVIYNLGTGFAGADAYVGSNRASYGGTTGSPVSNIVLSSAKLFPLASPANRFQVVQYAVTYKCDPVAQELRRYWNYTIAAAQPTPPAGGSSAQLARNVIGCGISYTPNSSQIPNGVVTINLKLGTTAGQESITFFQEAHVNNVP